MAKFQLKVNGKETAVEAQPDTPLLWILRDHLGLTGTKFGCGIAQCGACTVHANGKAIRSCSLPVSSLNHAEVTTIEGLSADGTHPLQQAWDEIDVPQCGYCQAGQLMSAAALLKSNANPTEDDIDRAMSGNICRCGTYPRIKRAILTAAKKGGAK